MKKTLKILDIYNLFNKYGDLNLNVNTPYGYKKIEDCDITKKNSSVIRTTTKRGLFIESSPEHLLKTKNGRFKKVITLSPGNKIKTINGNEEIKTIELLPDQRDLFDIQVADVKQYFSNGIVSHNSSLLDALSFCLFDTTSRTFKATKILNNRKKSFQCKVNFEIDDVDYYIERKAKKLKNGHVKVDVNFWTVDDTDEKISLNGDQRRSTNANIRKIIGTYEDFVLTTLSLQNNFTVFIDKTQKERKELLAQFMGMGVFDRLYTTAHEEISEVSVILKDFRKRDYDKELDDIDKDSKIYKKEYTNLQDEKKKLSKLEKSKNRELIKLTKKLKAIDSSIMNISVLEGEKKELKDTLASFNDGVNKLKIEHSDAKRKIKQLKLSIISQEKQDIIGQFNELIQYEQERSSTVVDIDKLKIDVQHKLKKMETLKNLEYDPNCSYCMNNIFVKDAIQTKKDLDIDKQLASKYLEKKDNLDTIIRRMNNIRTEKQKYDFDKEEVSTLLHLIESLDSRIEIAYEKVKNIETNIVNVDDKIIRYYDQEQDILFNKQVERDIDDLTHKMDDISYQMDMIDQKLQTTHGQLKVFDTNRTIILNKIKEVEVLERKYHAYEYYLDAVKRDGVPYELIEKSLPTIEGEVNDILTQIVDFNIILHMDGKNINTFIAYDEDNAWPLELCGGMERFISSLALRVGLINVCNLPRSNFLAVDEGFGSMDADNLNSVYMLFQYLKTQFTFILIVSHLDGMRDAVDNIIDINKIDGFSSIAYT